MYDSIKLRKYTVWETLSLGIDIFKEKLKDMSIILLIGYGPIYLILFLSPLKEFFLGGNEYGEILLDLIIFPFEIIIFVSIARIVSKTVNNENCTWREAIKYGTSIWTDVFSTGIRYTFTVLGLYLLLIVPGIVASISFIFWIYVVSIKGIKGRAALDYSKELVKNQWWKVLGFQLILSVFGVLLLMAFLFFLSFFPPIPSIWAIELFIISLFSGYTITSMALYFVNSDSLMENEIENIAIEPIPLVQE